MLELRSPGPPRLEESQPGGGSSPPPGVGVLQFQKVKKPLWGWESLFCCLEPGGGAGGCAEEVVGGMYKTGPSGPLCQLALPAPLTLHSLQPQGGSGEWALIPRTVTALGTLLDSWADRLHSIPEGSRTLDRVLRPIWLPQPPVQGTASAHPGPGPAYHLLILSRRVPGVSSESLRARLRGLAPVGLAGCALGSPELELGPFPQASGSGSACPPSCLPSQGSSRGRAGERKGRTS
ncbi:unnamed protein product [Nyctereutes procyonoides]|uniref:(raccoon dog) hypothetical protein n=1 Tax=Nyctereutes procyonoides TaxID=34880 RepID=A0A811ZI58_NYCPR|nr:unnamed protein product [Nyctereutes procyonoides]